MSMLSALLMLAADEGTTVSVEVVGLTSAKGHVECVLWASPSGFPRDTARGLVKTRAPEIRGGRAVCTFRGVPAGRFAVTMMHDENENGRVDTNFMGIPVETYGFSRNPTPFMRAPRFDEAAFVVAAEPVALQVAAK